jgi:hypothetical protein
MHFIRFAALAAAAFSMTAPTVAQQADPTNPEAHVRSERYRSVLHDYRFTPLPKFGDWRELNDRAEKIGGPMGQFRDQNQPYRKRRRR